MLLSKGGISPWLVVFCLACIIQFGAGIDLKACTASSQQGSLESHLPGLLHSHSSLLQHRAERGQQSVTEDYTDPLVGIPSLAQKLLRNRPIQHAAHGGSKSTRQTVTQHKKTEQLSTKANRTRTRNQPLQVVYNVLMAAGAMAAVVFLYRGMSNNVGSSSAEGAHDTTAKDVQIAQDVKQDNCVEEWRNAADGREGVVPTHATEARQHSTLASQVGSNAVEVSSANMPVTLPLAAPAADMDGSPQHEFEKEEKEKLGKSKISGQPKHLAAASQMGDDVRNNVKSASLADPAASGVLPLAAADSSGSPQERQRKNPSERWPNSSLSNFSSHAIDEARSADVFAPPPDSDLPAEVSSVAPNVSTPLNEAPVNAEKPTEAVQAGNVLVSQIAMPAKEGTAGDSSLASEEINKEKLDHALDNTKEQMPLVDRLEVLRELKELQARQNGQEKLEQERREAMAAMAQVEAEQAKLLDEENAAERAFKRLPYKARSCASTRIGKTDWDSSSWRARLAAAEEPEEGKGTRKKGGRKKKPAVA